MSPKSSPKNSPRSGKKIPNNNSPLIFANSKVRFSNDISEMERMLVKDEGHSDDDTTEPCGEEEIGRVYVFP